MKKTIEVNDVYINSIECIGEPCSSRQIWQNIMDKLKNDFSQQRVSVALKRHIDKGNIVRLENGLYATIEMYEKEYSNYKLYK